MKQSTLKGLLLWMTLTTYLHASLNISSATQPAANTRGLAQLTSLLTSIISPQQYPGYPAVYSPVNYAPPIYSNPMIPRPALNMQPNPLNQLVNQLQQAPGQMSQVKPERELISRDEEQEKLENFLEQFLLVTKRHSYKSYFSFKLFYKTYLEKAEDMLKINHQELRYLLNLEKYIFLQNYNNGVLNYVAIRGQMHLIIQQEQSDLIDCLARGKSFTLRTDYYVLLRQKDPLTQNILKKKLSPHQEAIFSSKFTKIRHLMKMERVWHKCLRNGRKDHISTIHRRELKKSIRKGQKSLKKVIEKAKKFMEKHKDMKKDKETRIKTRVLYYLLDMIQDHKMGSFYTRLSSFYKDISSVSRRKWNDKKQELLDKKTRKLHGILSPLSFLTSVYRVINLNRNKLNEIAPDAHKLSTLSVDMSKPFEDPRTRSLLKIYFDILLERIEEIDFFLFRKPKKFFSVSAHKVLQSVLISKTPKEFIQFNANLDLLFIQIAKIEFYLFAGRKVQIMNDVRPKYFRFFRTLIEPLARLKSNYDLDEIEHKDKEFFEDIENIQSFREMVKEHIHEHDSDRIGDLEIFRLKSDPKDSLALTEEDVHTYLKSDEYMDDDLEVSSDRSNDFFYPDSKPTNRHEGSEGNSDINESMISQIDLYEKELKGTNSHVSSPVSQLADDSVIQKETSLANASASSLNSKKSDQSKENQSVKSQVSSSPKSSTQNETQENESPSKSPKSNITAEQKTQKSESSVTKETTPEASVASQESSLKSNSSEEETKKQDLTKEGQNNVILTDSSAEKSKSLDQDEDQSAQKIDRKMPVLNMDEFTTSDGDEQTIEKLDVNPNEDAHDVIEIKKEETDNKNPKKIPEIPVKVNKKTVINQVWLNGGFKKKNSKFSVKDFENEEGDVESMIVSLPDMKKVKISRLLVLKAKIVSELFMKFFGNSGDELTVQMINSGQKLMKGGIMKKSTSQKLNYLLLVVAEANKFRETIADDEYFDQILDLWKVFMIEFACSCQLKLYIRLLKRIDQVEDLKFLLIWKNLTRFLSKHKDYDFIKCDGDILRVWMNSTLFVRKKRESAIIRDTFKKVYIKHRHREKAKSIHRQKMLLKKVLNKIRHHSVSTPMTSEFNKLLLNSSLGPGNKVTDTDPKYVKTVLQRKPLTHQTSQGNEIMEPQGKTMLLRGLDPGNKITDPPEDDGGPEGPDSMNYSKKFQTLLKKKTVMNMLMGHLKKIKLKSSEAVEPDVMRFTKSLVVGALINSKKGEPSLSNLAKLSFKMTPKNLSYIEKLKTEYRNVDNIRISDKSDKIFGNLKKIFFKPIRDVPHVPPEKTLKKYRKKMRKRFRKRKAMFRIFKKCKWGQKNENGCCEDGAGGDDSVYNYRPNYEFKFDFEDEEQMAQFEEFLRNTEAVDKLLSSNMIDMAKAKQELEKAKFSKTFHINVNGKKVNPEDLFEPKEDDKDKSGRSDASDQSTKSGESDKNKSNASSPKRAPAKVNPILNPVSHPLDDEDFENDMKLIDNGYKNQPSIENAMEVKDVPVDENGDPIDPDQEMENLNNKVNERKQPDDEIKEFIDRIQPEIDEEEPTHSNNSSTLSNDSVDQDLDNIISQDLKDKENNSPLPDNEDSSHPDDLHHSLDDGLQSPDEMNRVFRPANRNRDDSNYSDHPWDTSEQSSPKNFHDALDASDTQSGDSENKTEDSSETNSPELDDDTKRDNFYANQLVNQVEKDLDKKRPMKKYSFGQKKWDHEQVHTSEIPEDGAFGADYDRYPDMSDAMKSRLNKEIEETGGYPDLLDTPINDGSGGKGRAKAGQLKAGYMPFHLEDGNLTYSPLENTRFLI